MYKVNGIFSIAVWCLANAVASLVDIVLKLNPFAIYNAFLICQHTSELGVRNLFEFLIRGDRNRTAGGVIYNEIKAV